MLDKTRVEAISNIGVYGDMIHTGAEGYIDGYIVKDGIPCAIVVFKFNTKLVVFDITKLKVIREI